MAIIPVGIAVPDLRIPRMNPCTARIDQRGRECGATPAALYQRYCFVPSHDRDVWLCPIHASLAMIGMTMCRECEAMKVVRRAWLRKVLTEPLRIG